MATENRTPDDLQEAVAATLRRLRGEVRARRPTAGRVEPQLSAAAPQETPAPPLNEVSPEPDLLSRSEPEIPPAPAERDDGGRCRCLSSRRLQGRGAAAQDCAGWPMPFPSPR